MSEGGNKEKGFFQIIVHSFFVVPFLITVFCVLLLAGITLLTREPRNAYDYLEDIKAGGLTKRWQSAFELSRILGNPKSVPRDDRFLSALTGTFESAKHDDARIRQYLALAMGRTGNPVFLKTLTDAFKDEKEENLPALIYAVGMLRQPEAVPALSPYLNHKQGRIRSLTVAALGNIAARDSVALLRKSLADPEPNVQWGAAVSLAKMGDAAGKGILLNMLDRGYWSKFPEVDSREQNNLILTAMDAAALLNDGTLKERVGQLARNDRNSMVRSAAMKIIQK